MKWGMLLLGSVLLASTASAQEPIVRWDFNDTNQPPSSPAPSFGAGEATLVGEVAGSFASGSGSSDPATGGDFAWSLASFPAQGQAPRSAGVQFAFSTAGYEAITLGFDWRASNTGSRALAVLYTTDGSTFNEAAVFTLEAGGVFTNRLSVDFTPFAGTADNPLFGVQMVSDFADGAQYQAANPGSAYGASGTWRFDTVTLVGRPLGVEVVPPQVLRSPVSQTVAIGAPASFSVEATGTAPLTYQWQRADLDLTNATNATLTLSKVVSTDAGLYRVRVSNVAGEVWSDPVALTVIAPPVISFTNVLENLRRSGDLVTNTFTEHALRPGERLSMTVFVADPEQRAIEVMPVAENLPTGAQWEIGPVAGSEATGTFIWQPSAGEAGKEFSVMLAAWNADATNIVSWKLYVPTEAEQNVVITEYLANPTSDPSAAFFNPLCRLLPAPNPSVDDEFVEIVNFGAAPVDLQNWTLGDGGSASPRLLFRDPILLSSSNCVVAYGGPGADYLPAIGVPAIPSDGGSGLSLNNGGDVILLRNAGGCLVERVAYSSAQTARDGSMIRQPAFNGPFVAHSSIGTRSVSPGWQNDGRAWTEPAEPVTAAIGRLAVEPGPEGSLRLSWLGDGMASYSVWVSSTAEGPYTKLIGDLATNVFADPAFRAAPARFYRVSAP